MATLDMQGIKEIEGKYIKAEANRRRNKKIIDEILNGQIAEPVDLTQMEQDVKGELNDLGNQRFFKPSEINWKKEFENINLDEVEIEITGESADTQSMLTTIDKALTIIANPTYQTSSIPCRESPDKNRFPIPSGAFINASPRTNSYPYRRTGRSYPEIISNTTVNENS
jgi:hypothetical protein